MIKNFLLTSFLFCSIGCAAAGELALNTAAGALGNMIDRRIDVDVDGNEKLEKKIEELELELIDELEKRLEEREKNYGGLDSKNDKWGRTNW